VPDCTDEFDTLAFAEDKPPGTAIPYATTDPDLSGQVQPERG
jgi:hypothetical protein